MEKCCLYVQFIDKSNSSLRSGLFCRADDSGLVICTLDDYYDATVFPSMESAKAYAELLKQGSPLYQLTYYEIISYEDLDS